MGPFLVDLHLDLTHLGRDLTLSLEALRGSGEAPIPMVSLPALREARVALAFATLFASPCG